MGCHVNICISPHMLSKNMQLIMFASNHPILPYIMLWRLWRHLGGVPLSRSRFRLPAGQQAFSGWNFFYLFFLLFSCPAQKSTRPTQQVYKTPKLQLQYQVIHHKMTLFYSSVLDKILSSLQSLANKISYKKSSLPEAQFLIIIQPK